MDPKPTDEKDLPAHPPADDEDPCTHDDGSTFDDGSTYDF